MQRAKPTPPVSISESEERRERREASSDENSNSAQSATVGVSGGESGREKDESAATSVSPTTTTATTTTTTTTPPDCFGVVGKGKGKRNHDGVVKQGQAWQTPTTSTTTETTSSYTQTETGTGIDNEVWNPTKYATPKNGVNPFHHGLYSRASGIDVVGILVKVATRKSPQIDLGVIDLSCALVICAADVYDEPVIYVSEGFEILTGYKSQEVLGRNCRFLQRPLAQSQSQNAKADLNSDTRSGHVLQLDSEDRQRDDGGTRKRLRLDVKERRETQVQVLNYKKGGQAFVNILSIVPIGEGERDVKYLVGFMAEAKRWHL